jgi:putative tryptophan/tyrosine transport system substrate-binding protein
VIGILASVSPAPYARFIEAIKQGLREAGYVEGRNVAIEYRWADGQYDRLPQLATELVDRGVAVIILVGGGPTTAAAKAATATVPIVFNTGEDPVKTGAVAALNRPGGNATGVSLLTVALEAKRLQLLHELVPTVAVIAIIVNPKNPQADQQLQELQAAARTLGVQVEAFKAGTPNEIDTAFANAVQQRAGALHMAGDAFFNTRKEQFIVLSARHALPTVFSLREFPAAGGLMSYGPAIQALQTLTASREFMRAEFSRARSRRRCLSSRQSRSNSSSTCKPQRHSASAFRCLCSDVPTRSSSEKARVNHASRRHGGVAAHGASAAAGDAGGRVSQRCST